MKMPLLVPLRLGVILAAACMVTGCSSHKADEGTRKLMESADPGQTIQVPFVVKEAELPKGFPPPGPVGEVVIKRYPAYRAAVQQAQTPDGRKSPNGMFSPLFNHIKKNSIAMTAPVEMVYSEGETQPMSMAFLYRDSTLGKTGPDATVEVADLPSVRVLSIGLRGGYDEANYKIGLTRLQKWMTDHPGCFTQSGPPRYLGYNSPFIFGFLKFGEVQIPIK